MDLFSPEVVLRVLFSTLFLNLNFLFSISLTGTFALSHRKKSFLPLVEV